MAKVHPGAPRSSSYLTSSKQETFTIWMKSLVLNCKGCTVFDSNGQIVYRVDNYSSKCRDVYLMDFKGEVLFTILRKEKFRLFRFWEGYKSTGADRNPKRPGFQNNTTLDTNFGPVAIVTNNLFQSSEKYILNSTVT
ncbi:Protein LURP-one-related 11 [Morus notabilis]|uniref:Protein LURP-one-related 11 n=1 Tax=Morus notabilis TaxID=981085 RepID=W9RQH6_9ROSA|nr:Protein LURP-one-related 11 [Morus notabilis]